jgi:uncharacterized protein
MGSRALRIRRLIETLAAAGAGVALFHVLKLPAPSLSGAMVGVALLLAAGRKVDLPRPVAEAAMLASGVAMGAAVTPEMLSGFQKYPLSLAMLLLCVGATILATQAFLVRVCHADRLTAFFAATPGALSSVLAVAADTRADILRVTIIQSVRLFVLVAVLPSAVIATGGLGSPAPRPDATLTGLAALCAAGLVCALAVARLGLAASWIFGGLIGSAALHGSGLVGGDAPAWFMEAAFGLVGIYIGSRFATITRDALTAALMMSVGALIVSLAVAVLFSAVLHGLSGLPFGMILIAFAPGGLEAMLVLGASLGLDPIYVGLHHLVRFFGIAFLLPLAMPLLRRMEADVPSRDGN